MKWHNQVVFYKMLIFFNGYNEINKIVTFDTN